MVECVPNISEGRDEDKIHAIAETIRQAPDVMFLHQDMGHDANRTVLTFAGTPRGVLDAAKKMVEKAVSLIDMSKQKGEHPRIGAVDVFPFVPLINISIDQCVKLSKELGQYVGEKINIPVYLYEEAASVPERKNLSNIRKGGYEALSEKLKQSEWKPDFGPSRLHRTAGAMVIGARPILIAFNINLKTEDVRIAKIIAEKIRESGYIIKTENGDTIRKAGMFKACKAIGWRMPEFGCAQVSTNLVNYHMTPPHAVYETCKKLARELGTDVAGSELVGMIPLEALKMAGVYYLDSMNPSEEDLIPSAIEGLGLDVLSPFVSKNRILEYKIQNVSKGEKR